VTFGDLTPAGVPAKFATLGLTFDDVLLLPNESDVIPSEVDTTSLVSRRIKVRIPLLSSAMDTVTEARMAIAIAREGGLGILHRNMSIEEQAAQVDRVKRSEAGMVSEPITVGPDRTIGEVDAMCAHYHISESRSSTTTCLLGIDQPRHAVRDDPGRLVRDVTRGCSGHRLPRHRRRAASWREPREAAAVGAMPSHRPDHPKDS
jgi:IMP dehydrogenase